MLKVLRYVSLRLLEYKIVNFHLQEILLNALCLDKMLETDHYP